MHRKWCRLSYFNVKMENPENSLRKSKNLRILKDDRLKNKKNLSFLSDFSFQFGSIQHKILQIFRKKIIIRKKFVMGHEAIIFLKDSNSYFSL